MGEPLPERRTIVLLVLVLLTPGIPELLTSSTPLGALTINPGGFLVNLLLDIGLYTMGALLIREVSIVWGRGWPSILLLGAAYGIAEEGLAVHTFFQSGGAPVGVLGTYGHYLGVNWVWAVGLTLFHAVYSIALPIFLLHSLFPRLEGRRLLGRAGLGLVALLYFATVLLLSRLPNAPSLALVFLFVGLAGLFVAMARFAPAALLSFREGPSDWPGWAIALASAIFLPAWFLVGLGGAALALPPLVTISLLLLVDGLILTALLAHVGTRGTAGERFAVATGLMASAIAFGILGGFRDPLAFLLIPVYVAITVVAYRRRVEQSRASPVAPGDAPPVGAIPPGAYGIGLK